MKIKKSLSFFIIPTGLLCLLIFNSICSADIYKYRDEEGRWQFSDKPKKGVSSKLIHANNGGFAENGKINDITSLLTNKYQFTDPVQKATMAVVTVKSKLGAGSGFFVTKDCYLVTNKHVVRPAKGKQWDMTQAKIKQNALMLKRSKLHMSQQKERLAINKQKLEDFLLYAEGLSSGRAKDLAYREYALFEQQYQQDLQQFNEAQLRLNRNEKKFNQQQSDFNFSSVISNVAQSFEVVLKDNTTIRAKLIKVASTDDLALLKVDQCQAPYLKMHSKSVMQGMTVHAIGSPLGLRDQLTSGTVTQVSPRGIATDAQILPGNSGGPLVTDEGYVVAVNTIKVARESALNTGFGLSIPIAKVQQNFGNYLK